MTNNNPQTAVESTGLVAGGKATDGQSMTMVMWYATEGGRKCPMCGRYAKREQIGNLSGWIGNARVSAYGHLPGHGCNQTATDEVSQRTGNG